MVQIASKYERERKIATTKKLPRQKLYNNDNDFFLFYYK